jgi:hypothetical protein
MTSKFTGIKYDFDCGFFAIHAGQIVCPKNGISGDKNDALMALVRSTKQAYDAQFGNADATAATQGTAHSDYMQARMLLATWETETKANEVARQLAI